MQCWKLAISRIPFTGIVSQDFLWLKFILKDMAWDPDVPLKVYFFNLTFSYCFLSFKLS